MKERFLNLFSKSSLIACSLPATSDTLKKPLLPLLLKKAEPYTLITVRPSLNLAGTSFLASRFYSGAKILTIFLMSHLDETW